MTRSHFSDWAALDTDTRHVLTATASDRARRLERRLNAFVVIEENSASSASVGPLAGVPYAAKDLFATGRRLPTCGLTDGAKIDLEGNAEVLGRLDDAGAHCFGFTTMTELAYEPSGYNAVRNRARNPWNLDFIPGGSSSGSAVAVASGSAVIAIGSDTAGSLRIPAHCCGVTAWKPTFGIVPVSGALQLAPTLDVIGLLARSAADLAPAAEVLVSDHLPPTSATIDRAVVLTDALSATEPSVRSACQQGIDAIEGCGMRLERREGLAAIEAIDAHVLIVLQAEAARTHRSRLADPLINVTLRKRLGKGLAIEDAALAASCAARTSLAKDFEDKVLGRSDAALLPVMAIRTPPAVETDPTSQSFSARNLYDLSRFTRFVNMLGFPAIAIPVGFDDRGMPVGLQVVGRPGSDRLLLALATAVQAKTNWHARVPAAIVDLVVGWRGMAA
jgi:aspartyl-tRNA(Asn)/glutamyl-tRNA(Gln) amidotransferase subunit A